VGPVTFTHWEYDQAPISIPGAVTRYPTCIELMKWRARTLWGNETRHRSAECHCQCLPARFAAAEGSRLRSSIARLPLAGPRSHSGTLPCSLAATTLPLLAAGIGDQHRIAALRPGIRARSGQPHWFLVDRILPTGELLQRRWETAEFVACTEGLLSELERVG
jgi:hypothetical protein